MNGDQGASVAGGGGSVPPGAGYAVDPRSKVAGPAIALMATAGIGIALQVIGMLFRFLGLSLLGPRLAGDRAAAFAMLSGGLGIVLGVVGIVIGIVILIGAAKMRALESYGFAMTITILAMIPCISPCCLLGLPIGIWSLVVLLDPNVKSAFRP
jgi:hypothetical protein